MLPKFPWCCSKGGGDEGGLRGSVGTGGQSAEAPRLNPPCYGEIVR